MNRYLKKNFWYFLGFLILVWVIIANLFPKGYVLAGGDVAQIIDPLENFKTIFYDWQGVLPPFYLVFWLLAKIGISSAGQLSWYLGVFIFGAYISFDIFCRIVFEKTANFLRMLVSLFYALNIYTLYIFSYSWGYTAYQSLYIFIPVLIALYVRFLMTQKNIWGTGFVLVLFLSSSGFGNPAYALSFAIFLFILTIAFGSFGFFRWNKRFANKIGALLVFSLAVNAYWILPIIPHVRGGVDNLFSGNIIDLNWWLSHTSNPLVDTFRLSQYSNWYFPDNFPYSFILKYQPIFVLLTVLPIIFIASGMFLFKKMDRYDKKYYLIFFISLFFLMMFIAKVRPPFEVVNHFFYNVWGMNTLRGYEKFAIYTPFVFSVLLLISARIWIDCVNTFCKTLVYLFLVLILAVPLPFYLGKLQQNMSAIFVRDTVSQEAKNYQKAKYSFLVKIPDEYYQIQKIINSDPLEYKIAILPNNEVDSPGWSNYVKWKLVGMDITQALYNKRFIDANSYYFNDWLFAKDFSESDVDPEWIVKLLGMMNVKYIIFHKDVEYQFFEKSADKMFELEKGGLIKLLEKNDYFNLYVIDEKYILPKVILQKSPIEIEQNINSVNAVFSEVKIGSAAVNFEKINPRKFEVELFDSEFGSLVFLEPFDSNWSAYAVTNDGNKYKIKDHYKELGYANGWKIENGKNLSKIVIEYLPIRLAYYGIFLSAIVILFLIVYSLLIWKRKLNLKLI